jgi:hypothetical protein
MLGHGSINEANSTVKLFLNSIVILVMSEAYSCISPFTSAAQRPGAKQVIKSTASTMCMNLFIVSSSPALVP